MSALVTTLLAQEGSSPYWGILFMLLIAVGIGLAAILIGWMVRPRSKNAAKQSAYECGMDPVGDTRGRIPVRYYTVAMLFLLLDAEAIFLWPWATAFLGESGLVYLVEAVVFIAVVGLGYAYVWRQGAFEWKTR